jgi:hypothetical protein
MYRQKKWNKINRYSVSAGMKFKKRLEVPVWYTGIYRPISSHAYSSGHSTWFSSATPEQSKVVTSLHVPLATK